MIDYFKMALNKYADFKGRSRRSEYWYFVLTYMILYLLAVGIDTAVIGYPILTMVIALGLFIPSLSVGIRRLHDTDRSGWWYLIAFVPLIGTILLIVWFATDGTPGTNKWGRNPKETADDIVDHLVD